VQHRLEHRRPPVPPGVGSGAAGDGVDAVQAAREVGDDERLEAGDDRRTTT
jgi:hypothetical protein